MNVFDWYESSISTAEIVIVTKSIELHEKQDSNRLQLQFVSMKSIKYNFVINLVGEYAPVRASCIFLRLMWDSQWRNIRISIAIIYIYYWMFVALIDRRSMQWNRKLFRQLHRPKDVETKITKMNCERKIPFPNIKGLRLYCCCWCNGKIERAFESVETETTQRSVWQLKIYIFMSNFFANTKNSCTTPLKTR